MSPGGGQLLGGAPEPVAEEPELPADEEDADPPGGGRPAATTSAAHGKGPGGPVPAPGPAPPALPGCLSLPAPRPGERWAGPVPGRPSLPTPQPPCSHTAAATTSHASGSAWPTAASAAAQGVYGGSSAPASLPPNAASAAGADAVGGTASAAGESRVPAAAPLAAVAAGPPPAGREGQGSGGQRGSEADGGEQATASQAARFRAKQVGWCEEGAAHFIYAAHHSLALQCFAHEDCLWYGLPCPSLPHLLSSSPRALAPRPTLLAGGLGVHRLCSRRGARQAAGRGGVRHGAARSARTPC
jgi:hypothetical protein